MGVRPACIPFDGESDNGLSSNEMIKKLKENPKLLDKLKAISEITIIIGPFYDTGESIVIANTKNFSKTNKMLKTLKRLDKLGSKKAALNELHIAMGKLLGYTCPIGLTDIFKLPKVYDIYFLIDGNKHLGVWCPIDFKHITRALEQLEEINKTLSLIDKKADLIIGYMNN